MKKRLLAMIMAFVMAMSLLPMSALAVGGGDAPEPSAPANAEGLEVSKIATANSDGTYTLTMEAYTTGTVTSSTSSKPTDIVLVLDMSGSMNDSYTTQIDTYTEVYGREYTYRWFGKKTGYGFNNNTSYYIKNEDGTYQKLKYSGRDQNGYEVFYYTTGSWRDKQYFYPTLSGVDTAPEREYNYAVVQFYKKETTVDTVNKLQSLKNAVNSFIDQTATQNQGIDQDKQHRISIVKFASDKNNSVGNSFTENTHYNCSQIVTELNYVNKDTVASLKETVNGLSASGATRVDYGMEQARTALGYTVDNGSITGTAPEGRNQVVIVFTDGVPTTYTSFSKDVANAALGTSKSLKDKNVDVYSICIEENAKVTDTLPTGTTDINRFMHLLSSNYPNAINMNDRGEGTGGSVSNGYYMVPSNDMSLAGIFEKISQDIATPGISLGTSAKLVDTVTQYFDLVTEKPIVVKAVPCTGVNDEESYTWDDTKAEPLNITPTVIPNEDGTNTISVTGFDYDANFVSGTARKVNDSDFYGKKLVVEVTVTPKEGFWGGNNVPTNAGTSGIYDKDEKIVEAFPVPQVNVPLRVPDLTGKNVNIYCGNTAPTAEQLVDTSAFNVNDWRSAFVNIGKPAVTGTVSNTADGEYSVSITVTPKTAAADSSVGAQNDMAGVTKPANATVNVYKPVITFQDTTIEKGTSANYSKNLVKTEWKHGTGETATTDTGVTMLDKTRPNLTLTYNPNAAKFDDDQNVAVTQVQNGSTDIKDYTTFGWQKNTESSQCTDCTAAPANNQFRVHVVDTTPPFGEGITIQKEANQKAPLPGETVTYTITLTNSGAEEKTVTVVDELPFGLKDAVVTDFTSDSNVTYDKKTGTITWTNVSVPGKTDDKNGTVKLTYDVTIPNSAEPGTIYNNNVKIVNGTDESQRDTETITVAATVAIEGMKVVEQKGNVTPPADAKFTFSLKLVKTGDTDVENGDTYTVTSGAGDFSFQPIRYTEAGTYVYEVTETGTDTNWTYDKTKYTVTVIVSSDKESNKLLAPELVYSVGDKSADKMTFTNTYTKNESTGGGGGSSKPPVLNKEDHYAYIVGYPDGTVKPQGNITRAEVATIFFRMLTDDSRNEFWSQTNSYSDVSEGQWFNNAISTLANAGILSGYPDGTFRPNAPITRAEFTKIAASFFERVEYTIDNPFNDVDDDDWFYKFVMAAYEGGLITGYPEGDFRPNANISRAESVTIVNRTLERAPDADHFLKDMIVWPDNAENAWYYEAVQEATNSHEYVVKGTGTNKYEEWTKILEVRDWPALEKDWSNANSAAGGEVVK